jgi:general secretion pathway protein I
MADSHGFTLVEVLVSLAILALGFTALFEGLGDGGLAASVADRQRVATEAAQSLLDELGQTRPLVDGESEGDFAAGEHWRLSITPFGAPSSDQAAAAGAPRLNAHLIVLGVTWRANGATQELDFHTLRLGAVQ